MANTLDDDLLGYYFIFEDLKHDIQICDRSSVVLLNTSYPCKSLQVQISSIPNPTLSNSEIYFLNGQRTASSCS